MQIELPRASAHDDPLAALQLFHEALRDVAAWVAGVVDEQGCGSPRDARWLRAFLRGPLAWHENDEELFVLPRVQRRSEWLDHALEGLGFRRGDVDAAASALVELSDVVARGDTVRADLWRAAAEHFRARVDRCLAWEDGVLLPTARLLLDKEERAALRHELVSSERAREWGTIDAAGDEAPRRAVHAITTHTADGGAVHASFAVCPRDRSIRVSHCMHCPHLEALDVAADGRGSIACAVDAGGAGPRIADIMSRDVHCVASDTPAATAVELLATHDQRALPVVDELGRPVGLVSQTDIIRALAAHHSAQTVRDVMTPLAFAVREGDPVPQVARLLAWEGVHQVVVVNETHELVGVVSALAVMRALAPTA